MTSFGEQVLRSGAGLSSRDPHEIVNSDMKMYSAGIGPGLGIKDYRVVFMFRNKETYNKFVEEGWEFGGSADAAAKSGEKGGEAGAQGSIDSDIVIYTMTEAGIALQATVAGTKYWKDDELN